MKPVFVGSGVAVITPFGKDGKIDYGLFSKIIEFHIRNNTDAVIVCGTTGEGSTLTTAERLKLFSAAVEQASGRVPIIAGTGSNSTSFSKNLIRDAEKIGINAHLSVTPYYNKASQAGVVKHYFTLAEHSQKPIVIYNVPSRTGVNIKPETYLKLSEHENILAVKEADPNISKLQKSISLCGDKLDFYCGNDDLNVTTCYLGCKGVISVLSNLLPRYTHKMTLAAINGDYKLSNSMQRKVLPLIEALFTDVNPIPVKYMLEKVLNRELGYRLPLCSPDNACINILDNTFEAFKGYLFDEFVDF